MSLQAVSLSEQIARHLGEQIITGELAPGSRLPENELAKQLDVSTNSLREAFRLLEKQHMIELQPRKGARVCEVTDEQVRDLYEFLFMLLSRLAGLAAARWQPGEIEDLVEMLPQLEQHFKNDDMRSAHQLAFRFVEVATVRFAHNRYLTTDIQDLIPLLKRYSFIALQEDTSEFRRVPADLPALAGERGWPQRGRRRSGYPRIRRKPVPDRATRHRQTPCGVGQRLAEK